MSKITLPDDHSEAITILLEKLHQALPIHFSKISHSTVLHVGAHKGEEVPFYKKYGFDEIYLIEANPNLVASLQSTFTNEPCVSVINCAVSDKSGIANFYIHTTKKGSVESASLLPLKKLGEIVPIFDSKTSIQVSTRTLDQIFYEEIQQTSNLLLCLDIQGSELNALKGAKQLLKKTQAIICEVNLIENYDGCALEKDIESILSESGFTRYFTIYHELYDETGKFPAWGEGLWIKI